MNPFRQIEYVSFHTAAMTECCAASLPSRSAPTAEPLAAIAPISGTGRARWAHSYLGLKQIRTSGSDPLFHIRAKPRSECEHLARFFVRHGPCKIIATNVAFLAKAIKGGNDFAARSCSDRQRLDHAIVMIIPRCSITCSGQGCGCCLESRIVGDRKLPVSRQLLDLASHQIAIRKPQQVGDLLATGRMVD